MLAQLYAVKAQMEAVVAAITAVIVAVEHQQTPEPMLDFAECPHPQELRRDTTTATGKHTFLCLACNVEVEGVA